MDNATFEHRHPCDEFTRVVQRCHKQYGKLGEDCVREELLQKQCFAQLHCKHEARRFYDEKKTPQTNVGAKWSTFLPTGTSGGSGDNAVSSRSKISCATLVEAFAKPENELLIPEGITKEDRVYCRKIVHELATCLSKKRLPISR